MARGGLPSAREQRRTVAHYADEWLALAAVKHGTRRRYAAALRRDVYPVIGSVPVGKVRHSHGRALLASLTRRKLSPASIAIAPNVANGVLTAARRDGLLVRDPLDGIRAPKQARRRIRHVPSLVDVVRASRCRGQLGYALVVLAGTGLLASELAGLRLDDLDLLRRTVLVRVQVLLDAQTRRPYYETPKSPDGEREIPLPAFVVDGLAAWLAKRPARTIMLPVGEPDADELVELPLVFTAERGDGPTTQESLTARTASRSRRIGAERSARTACGTATPRSCTTPGCRSGPSIT